MARRAIYLFPNAPDLGDAIETYPGKVEDLDAAKVLLSYLGDASLDLLRGALARAYEDDREVLAREDGAIVSAVLRALPAKVIEHGITDEKHMLDDAGMERLRSSALARVLDIDPRRGADARHAMAELLGNIVGVAKLIEDASARGLVVVLG